MLKAIRYTLAAICLATSVACLALWWRSMTTDDAVVVADSSKARFIGFQASYGIFSVSTGESDPVFGPFVRFSFRSYPYEDWQIEMRQDVNSRLGRFGRSYNHFHFPLWYPALVFALAAVSAIRIRRFTLRSALVGISVVAALLGMAVAL